jgi:heme exporter protein A
VAPPAVELEDLAHAYGERPVLRGLDLRVEPGASLALFGDNGSGKTTLLRAVAGLLRPLRGRALVDGASPLDGGPDVRRRIGYAGHRALVWDGLSCRENLRLYADLYGLEHAAVEGALARVGLEDRGESRPPELSQGLRQRLGLARALLARPELLLLDEPHAGLDAAGAELLDRILGELRGSVTLLLSTHDHVRGRALCGTALTLRDGRLTQR